MGRKKKGAVEEITTPAEQVVKEVVDVENGPEVFEFSDALEGSAVLEPLGEDGKPTRDVGIDKAEGDIVEPVSGEDDTGDGGPEPQGATPQNDGRPEWLDPKFQTPEEQAKAYREAQKRMSQAINEEAKLRKVVDSFLLERLPAPEQNETPQQVLARLEAERSRAAQDYDLDTLFRLQDQIVDVKNYMARQENQAMTQMQSTEQVLSDFLSENEWIGQDDRIGNFLASTVYSMKSDPMNYGKTNKQILNEAAKSVQEFLGAARKPQYTPTPTPTTQQVVKTQTIHADPTAPHTEGGNAPPAQPKTFSRYELSKMLVENPQKYESMQREIQKAYAEGRVVN